METCQAKPAPIKDLWETLNQILGNHDPKPDPEKFAKAGREGLSYVSYQTAAGKPDVVGDHPHVTYWQGAALLTVSKQKTARFKAIPHDWVRGNATFSRASRWRFMKKLARTQLETLPKFCTLTYPKEFSGDPKRWKRDLKVFIQRLLRKFPKSAGCWKLEPQKRGAPHYHLFVWGIEYYELREWISQAWYEVVGSGDEKHLRAGTSVEKVLSWKEVKRYISKYLGKAVDTSDLGELWESVGRYWGFFNKEFVPWGKVVIRECTQVQAVQFMRYLRRYAHMKAFGSNQNLTAVVGSSDDWIQNLFRMDTS